MQAARTFPIPVRALVPGRGAADVARQATRVAAGQPFQGRTPQTDVLLRRCGAPAAASSTVTTGVPAANLPRFSRVSPLLRTGSALPATCKLAHNTLRTGSRAAQWLLSRARVVPADPHAAAREHRPRCTATPPSPTHVVPDSLQHVPRPTLARAPARERSPSSPLP